MLGTHVIFKEHAPLTRLADERGIRSEARRLNAPKDAPGSSDRILLVTLCIGFFRSNRFDMGTK